MGTVMSWRAVQGEDSGHLNSGITGRREAAGVTLRLEGNVCEAIGLEHLLVHILIATLVTAAAAGG